MKKITLFILKNCPYCREALRCMDDLYQSDPRYRDIPIEIIDEGKYPDIANQYDYYYVPTYYVGETKAHEGAVNSKIVKRVFDEALI